MNGARNLGGVATVGAKDVGRRGRNSIFRSHGRPLLTLLMLTIALITSALGVEVASAGRIDPPGHRDANHCITDAGADLSVLYGVSEQFVNRFCAEVSAGEHWRPFAPWVTDDGIDSAYPAGYVPSRPNPVEDFVAKLTIKLVIDGGISGEKTYFFSPAEAVRTDVSFAQLVPGAPPLPIAATMPRMQPLSVGQHTMELIWVLSAQHCDGLGDVVEDNCLPAGEISLGLRPIVVTKPEQH